MRKNLFSIIFCLLISVQIGLGQSVAKQIKRGEELMQNLSFINAIDIYKSLLLRNSELSDLEQYLIKINLGDAYFKTKEYKNAERLYADVFTNKKEFNARDINAFQRYAQVLASNGKYEESAAVWKKYNSLQGADKRGVGFEKLYKNIEVLTRNNDSYKLDYLGINTAYSDFSPTYYKNGLVFVSGRNKSGLVKRMFSWDNSSFLDLYLLDDLSKLKKESQNAILSSSNNIQNTVKSKSKSSAAPKTQQTPNDVNTLKYNNSYVLTDGKQYSEEGTIEVKEFSKSINSKMHEGPCTFFKNGKKIIFTRNAPVSQEGVFNSKKAPVNKLKLFSADNKGTSWTNITALPFNDPLYSCGHPAINQNDNILYFVSDMPGGFGGTDIYLTFYNNGNWSKPKNLGPLVNSTGNEMFPFVDLNGDLYFSSDALPGLGDLDIFYIKINKATGEPIGKYRNLGAPLNSVKDDFGILTDTERKLGYISSNRKRGGSDDDIYMFTRLGDKYGCRDFVLTVVDEATNLPLKNLPVNYALSNEPGETVNTDENGKINLCLTADDNYIFKIEDKAYLKQAVDFNNSETPDIETSELLIKLKKKSVVAPIKKAEPVPISAKELYTSKDGKNATTFKGEILTGKDGTPIQDVIVKFVNKCNGQIQEQLTGEDGKYEFERKPECDYDLVVTKELYGTSVELIPKTIKKNFFGKMVKTKAAIKTNPKNLFDTKMFKVGDVMKLENIYYDSESFKVDENAKAELNKLVNILDRYPNMIIEVSSHTDTRGNSLNNLRLSQLRATEVSKYLVSKGVKPNRVRGIGKGESEPINMCVDGVNCTEAEHQRNRRTEIKILTVERK